MLPKKNKNPVHFCSIVQRLVKNKNSKLLPIRFLRDSDTSQSEETFRIPPILKAIQIRRTGHCFYFRKLTERECRPSWKRSSRFCLSHFPRSFSYSASIKLFLVDWQVKKKIPKTYEEFFIP